MSSRHLGDSRMPMGRRAVSLPYLQGGVIPPLIQNQLEQLGGEFCLLVVLGLEARDCVGSLNDV